MELTAKAPPDGYTIMIMSGSFSTTPATHKPSFDPINTIIPVAEVGYTPFALSVHPSLPSKTTKELLALAKSKPGQLVYASPGVGSITHLATELMLSMTKLQMIHVPYKSTGAAMADLLSGQCQLIVGSLLPLQPYFQNGRLRPLAVTTAQRWYSLPDVPTLAETLPGYEVELWFGDGAQRHAAPHHRPAQCHDQQISSGPRDEEKPGILGYGALRRHPRDIRQTHPRRLRALGQNRQGTQHQAGVTVRTLRRVVVLSARFSSSIPPRERHHLCGLTRPREMARCV